MNAGRLGSGEPNEAMPRGLLIVDGRVATDRRGAKQFLGGISDERFDNLRRTSGLAALGRDWYTYSDLVDAVNCLRSKASAEHATRPILGDSDDEKSQKAKRTRKCANTIYRTPTD